jgi:hypothetical protein
VLRWGTGGDETARFGGGRACSCSGGGGRGADVVGRGSIRWVGELSVGCSGSTGAPSHRASPELFEQTPPAPQHVTQARVGALQRLETDRGTTVGCGNPIGRQTVETRGAAGATGLLHRHCNNSNAMLKRSIRVHWSIMISLSILAVSRDTGAGTRNRNPGNPPSSVPRTRCPKWSSAECKIVSWSCPRISQPASYIVQRVHAQGVPLKAGVEGLSDMLLREMGKKERKKKCPILVSDAWAFPNL